MASLLELKVHFIDNQTVIIDETALAAKEYDFAYKTVLAAIPAANMHMQVCSRSETAAQILSLLWWRGRQGKLTKLSSRLGLLSLPTFPRSTSGLVSGSSTFIWNTAGNHPRLPCCTNQNLD